MTTPTTVNKTKLQIQCEQIIKNLNQKEKIQFSSLPNDAARIKYLFPHINEVNHEIPKWTPKDLKSAETLKTNGNKFFQQHCNDQALNSYNEAIRQCPQNDSESKQLYAVLIANRSAVFYENKQYEKVLQDVAFLKLDGHHPNLEKIKTRETKALDALNALKSNKNYQSINEEGNINEELLWRSGNITYPAMSNKLIIKKDSTRGRYAVAKQNINSGEIIVVEKPYASVILNKWNETNCGFCSMATKQIYACAQCSTAVYCSLQCLEQARIYHQYECDILLQFIDIGMNSLLALRMITQRPLELVLSEANYHNEEKTDIVYSSENYYTVSHLVGHEYACDSQELLMETVMAAGLLFLLKTTDYFEVKLNNNYNLNCLNSGLNNGLNGVDEGLNGCGLSKEEIVVGQLLCKYLQILRCNSHEIEDLQQFHTVGIGVYPSVCGLFNHSCDPSVMRYSIKNIMVLRSIKPIKAGEIVYDNYGSLYWSNPKPERLHKMANNYRFDCNCQACEENWPLYKEMDSNIYYILCDCGTVMSTTKKTHVVCLKCKTKNNLRTIWKILERLEQKSLKADELLTAGSYAEAQNIYTEIFNTQWKFFALPFKHLLKTQKQLEKCFLFNAKTRYSYLC